jgi:hypothetical protein
VPRSLSLTLPEFRQSDVFHIHLLSKLVLLPDAEAGSRESEECTEFWATADANHVLVRVGMALKCTRQLSSEVLETRLGEEHRRIATSINRLDAICRELEAGGVRIVVIKSLDHWSDFGSDIDLLTNAPESRVSALMRSRFDAQIVPATIGDRLANKVNYQIHGIQELVEVHFGRLGQTGEHVQLAGRTGTSAARRIQRSIASSPGPRGTDHHRRTATDVP